MLKSKTTSDDASVPSDLAYATEKRASENLAVETKTLPKQLATLSFPAALFLILLAALGYWLAFATSSGAPAILPALSCIFLLARLPTSRQAFYVGLLAGLAIYVPHLLFFRSVFGNVGMLLWLIAAFPIGIFVFVLRHARLRFGSTGAMCLTPMLWTGIEYFRSELYYLKFAWILPGQAVAFLPGVQWLSIGVYGAGFCFAIAAALVAGKSVGHRIAGGMLMISLSSMMYFPAFPGPFAVTKVPTEIAGIQLEAPTESAAAAALEKLAIAQPMAPILVMSEYTFSGPVPQVVRDVVRKYHRYLVVGGVRPAEGDHFYDTAFVVGPDGKDVFQQGKSVPVQFMGDGLPAEHRNVWESPWGKIGIAVCYDISYSRAMDDFVREGAQGLIIPTMDLTRWGEYERRMLHGRMAPIRAAEYGIPVFSVWSSGVSLLTDRTGRLIATAGYPGQGEMIAGPFDLREAGHVPIDRPLALASSIGTGLFIVFLLMQKLKSKHAREVVPESGDPILIPSPGNPGEG